MSSQRDEPWAHCNCSKATQRVTGCWLNLKAATLVNLFSCGIQSQAWSVAWHEWDGRCPNKDSAACPPAAKRTGTNMSKRDVFRCLKTKRASGLINGESAMIQCDTISRAAASWNAKRCACACGRDRTQVMTEHGEDLVGTQWAGERSPASGSPAAKVCPATEHSTASKEWLYIETPLQAWALQHLAGPLQVGPCELEPGTTLQQKAAQQAPCRSVCGSHTWVECPAGMTLHCAVSRQQVLQREGEARSHSEYYTQYVDDLLAWLDKSSSPLWASLIVVLLLILGVPMSWRKFPPGLSKSLLRN